MIPYSDRCNATESCGVVDQAQLVIPENHDVVGVFVLGYHTRDGPPADHVLEDVMLGNGGLDGGAGCWVEANSIVE